MGQIQILTSASLTFRARRVASHETKTEIEPEHESIDFSGRSTRRRTDIKCSLDESTWFLLKRTGVASLYLL